MVEHLPLKQKVDSAHKIIFDAGGLELYPFQLYSTLCVIKFNADGEDGCLRFGADSE